jgi:hypothetical protein
LEVIVRETNIYAIQKLQNVAKGQVSLLDTNGTNCCSGKLYLFGILIFSMLYPQTGRHLREMWETPYQSSWTKFMGKGRFLQICTALHFNDNEDEDGLKSDSLHKIRPLYSIVKKTLGAYINLGSEHSFDEATMACHSNYGRHLIVFNGMKNIGKFHFKMYMMCCAVTYLTHNIKIHTRRTEEEGEINDEEQLGVEVSKIDSITLDMC